jgi:hypothetical protein
VNGRHSECDNCRALVTVPMLLRDVRIPLVGWGILSEARQGIDPSRSLSPEPISRVTELMLCPRCVDVALNALESRRDNRREDHRS